VGVIVVSARLVLLSYTLWEKPIQDGETDVLRLEFPTVEVQVLAGVQAVLKTI